MQTSLKALQLILFTIEDNKSRTLLEDSLDFNPGYQAGDVIHILQPINQDVWPRNDHQYVVQRIKHIITQPKPSADSSAYILLVEVAELSSLELDGLAFQPHIS